MSEEGEASPVRGMKVKLQERRGQNHEKDFYSFGNRENSDNNFYEEKFNLFDTN